MPFYIYNDWIARLDVTRNRKYQLRKQERGLCIVCSDTAEPGRVKCAKHLAIDRARGRRRPRTAPRCRHCGEPADPGYRRCLRCIRDDLRFRYVG